MHATVNESPSLPLLELFAPPNLSSMASIDMGDHTKRLAASSEAALEAGAEASSGPRQEDQKIFSILFNQARCLAFDTKKCRVSAVRQKFFSDISEFCFADTSDNRGFAHTLGSSTCLCIGIFVLLVTSL